MENWAPYRGLAFGMTLVCLSAVYAGSWPKIVFGVGIGVAVVVFEGRRTREVVPTRRARRLARREGELEADDTD